MGNEAVAESIDSPILDTSKTERTEQPIRQSAMDLERSYSHKSVYSIR